MTDRTSRLSRRGLLTGLGGAILTPALASAITQDRPSLTLQASAERVTLLPGQPDLPVWSLRTTAPVSSTGFTRGDEIEVNLDNQLPVAVALNWFGLEGMPVAEPLLGREPLASGRRDTFRVALRHAGTMMCDVRLLGDTQPLPSRPVALVVRENGPAVADRDQVILIEDWRRRANGELVAPGTDPEDAETLYTINGRPAFDINMRSNERLRFRIINGCQRNVIALKIEAVEVRVIALDGQPAEPFLARNGQLVLAPGTRIDVIIDALRPSGAISAITLHDGVAPRPIARLVSSAEAAVRSTPLAAMPPLPSNGLPSQLDLKNAMRFDLGLQTGNPSQPEWLIPGQQTLAGNPAFQAKLGRTVVLALTNRAKTPTVFRLHGHHFRLLDKLDDGWKPFWLDTLLIDAQQTQRIAFAAEYAGRWLMESMAVAWAAPRLARWFAVT